MKFSADEAAIIIQRAIRRHLLKNPPEEVNNNRGSFSKLSDVEFRENARQVLDDVNLFYEKLGKYSEKKIIIRNLCSDIDKIVANIKTVVTLDQCRELETSFSNELKSEEIIKRHNDQLKKLNLKWWEKLDIYDGEV